MFNPFEIYDELLGNESDETKQQDIIDILDSLDQSEIDLDNELNELIFD